ncbi:MAG: hypothetical protein VB934_07555, partial [Polyangiaceae bacterium]
VDDADQDQEKVSSLPVVAYGDASWLVMWSVQTKSAEGQGEGERAVYAKGAAFRDGQNASEVMIVGEAASGFDLAGGEKDFLFVWEADRSDPPGRVVQGMHLNVYGKSLGGPFEVSVDDPIDQRVDDTGPSVVADRAKQRYAMLWTHRVQGKPAESGIRGAWIDFASRKRPGSLSKWSPVSPANEDAGSSVQDQPTMAIGPKHHLVVWRDDRDGYHRIYGAMHGDKLHEACAPEGFPISTDGGAEAVVTFADDGHGFLVVWEAHALGEDQDLRAASVTTQCEVRDTPGVGVAGLEGGEWQPRWGRAVAGQVLLGFLRDAPMPLGSRRLKLRVVETGDLDTEECAQDADCASRHCVDGICCREICGTCEECSKESALCIAVRGKEDDSCTAPNRCDDAGKCLPADGSTCTDGSDCASGFCVDGVCCDTACGGDCERCDLSPGTCTPLTCAPYACDFNKGCETTCANSTDCAPGLQCFATGQCAPPLDARLVDGCACSWFEPRPELPPSWGFGLGFGLLAWAGRRWSRFGRARSSTRWQ